MSILPGEQSPAGKPQGLSNLTLRLITAAIALPIALFTAYVDGWWMAGVVALVAAIGVVEFYILQQEQQVQGSSIVGVPMAVAVIAAFSLKQHGLWLAALALGAPATLLLEISRHPQEIRRSLFQVATTLAGVLYVAFPLGFLVALRTLPDGWTWALLVLILTWGTDTFAYFGGRLWGRRRLAPILSPKKSLEGAIAGIVGGILVAALWLLIYGKLSTLTLILIGIAPLAAIVGDLAESAMKRFFQVKDSHIARLNILPGHGGVLDRIDSLLFVSTVVYFYLMVTGIAA